MTSIAFYTRTDGLLMPRSERAQEWVKSHGGGHLIEGEFAKNSRTPLQNRFLWGWIYPQLANALDEAGITINDSGIPWCKDTLHAAMQRAYLVTSTIVVNGCEAFIYESTSKMSKKRFAEYIEQIKTFAWGTWEITIPDPRENFWEEVAQELGMV